jgi:hypothetical protein
MIWCDVISWWRKQRRSPKVWVLRRNWCSRSTDETVLIREIFRFSARSVVCSVSRVCWPWQRLVDPAGHKLNCLCLQLVTSYAATGSHFMILLFHLLSHNVVQNGRNKERLFGFPWNERWDRACFYTMRIHRRCWILTHGCKTPGRLVAVVTKFCTVAPNICSPQYGNLLAVTSLQNLGTPVIIYI